MAKPHASLRAKERMGQELTRYHLSDLRFRCLKRKNEQAWYVGPGSRSVERWVAVYMGEAWYFAFDPSTKLVVTVYDPPSDDKLQHLLGSCYDTFSMKLRSHREES